MILLFRSYWFVAYVRKGEIQNDPITPQISSNWKAQNGPKYGPYTYN